MRTEITNQLNANSDYWLFLRENPKWHQALSRYPEKLKDFFDEYKVIRKKRFIDKIDDISTFITLAETFLKK